MKKTSTLRTVLVLGLALGLVSPSWGAEASKIDFGVALVDLDGKAMRDPDETGRPGAGPLVTVGRASAAALVTLRDPSGAEQAKNYKLALQIVNGGLVELSAADIKRIEDAVAKAYAPIISGQVWKIIDPASVK